MRALSVVAVICYHAGFSWMHGGWIGVEVFFVVSGFLITSLLLDEREASGSSDLGRFWLRRARRLLPALAVVLATVAVATLAVGSAAERGDVRRDLPWALGYLGNWGQIVGDVPYYAGDPPLLRHLWSLAIEEQFYLLWPLAFVALMRIRLRPVAIARLLAGVAGVAMVWTFLLQPAVPAPLFGGVDRVNFMYLSTPTRAERACSSAPPPRSSGGPGGPPSVEPSSAGRRTRPRTLDAVGGVALGALACIAAVATLTAGYVYQWLLPLVTVLALVAVLVVVHPAAAGMRPILGWAPLVAVGRRSYGLYLWHWPVFVLAGATTASVAAVRRSPSPSPSSRPSSRYRYVETAGPARRARALVASAGDGPRPRRCCRRGAAWSSSPAATWRSTRTTRPRAATTPQFIAADARRRRSPPTTPASRRRCPARAVGRHRRRLAGPLARRQPARRHRVDVHRHRRRRSTAAACTTPGRVHSARTSFRNSSRSAPAGRRSGPAAVEQADYRSPSSCSVRGTSSTSRRATARVLTFGTPAWDDAPPRQPAGRASTRWSAPGPKVGAARGAVHAPGRGRGRRRAAAARAGRRRPSRPRQRRVPRRRRGAAPATVTFVEGPDAWCADEAVATDVAHALGRRARLQARAPS